MTESSNFAEVCRFLLKFIWNEYSVKKLLVFGIARIYGPGTNFSTGGRIKILPDFKFPQIYMYHISLKSHWAWFFLSNQLFVHKHVKNRIKTILIKLFEQNVDYAKVDQFSTPSFRNDDVSRKIMTSEKQFLWQMVDI